MKGWTWENGFWWDWKSLKDGDTTAPTQDVSFLATDNWHPLSDANHANMLEVEGWFFVIFEAHDGKPCLVQGHRLCDTHDGLAANTVEAEAPTYTEARSLAAAKAKLEKEGK